MYNLIQKFLLRCEAESSHDFSIKWLKRTQRSPLMGIYRQQTADNPVTIAGVTFRNAVGLAAGLDKNGECIDALAAMGFGYIEIGTVTPKPQSGNPKPRLFRLPEKQAIINRMGFNNKGVDYLVEQVKAANYNGTLGINIGKNKDTAEDKALDDYLICLKKVYPYASYVTINISSPNTPGLRNLQYGEALEALLIGLKSAQSELAEKHNKYVPLFIKIAPDLSAEEVQGIAGSLIKTQMDGVIATNTTLDRAAVEGLEHATEAGGLSGEVLCAQSLSITQQLHQALDGKLPIIGVGGIHDPKSARERMEAGAQLIQIYSSFIYQGPQLVKQLVDAIK